MDNELATVALNAVVLFGCFSPSFSWAALFRSGHLQDLAQDVHSIALRANNETKPPLVPHELPLFWYFGLGGVCDHFQDEIHCRREFSPSDGILILLEDSIRDNIRRSHGQWQEYHYESSDGQRSSIDQLVKDVVASWSTALTAAKALSFSPSFSPPPSNESVVIDINDLNKLPRTVNMKFELAFVIEALICGPSET
ncbi:hypothetical protein VTJ04DRAFT_9888 [Mycothermus thermophilus]|uniref:uncharacterized protein n=1 Tax=Humicola insolens TaxID=85995 RepID=UPI0037437146